MIASGFVEEVKFLLDHGFTLDDPPMSAIGYKEIILYLQSESTLEESIRAIKKRTRQFVRRQANWFKESDDRILWFDAGSVASSGIVKYFQDSSGWKR